MVRRRVYALARRGDDIRQYVVLRIRCIVVHIFDLRLCLISKLSRRQHPVRTYLAQVAHPIHQDLQNLPLPVKTALDILPQQMRLQPHRLLLQPREHRSRVCQILSTGVSKSVPRQ